MIWAIRIKYKFNGEDKWRQHTTKWYDNSGDAWEEKETWEKNSKTLIIESQSSLIHKKK